MRAPAPSASIAANSFSIARADGAPSDLVEVNGLVQLLTNEVVMTGKFTVARQRLLDALGVSAAQRSGRVPRQKGFDLLALRRFVVI